ncbi:hypothetical protein BV898_14702 [Hypsibius exemplaris]|uniref:Uncharacterized protein n=1 Tax=Hypsibius exemplaris TaxID=2072580 RepID=A0A9X6N998_HYPEX|nr:hypothetical protein BV898_14702 [Hypsibius exemplaris]
MMTPPPCVGAFRFGASALIFTSSPPSNGKIQELFRHRRPLWMLSLCEIVLGIIMLYCSNDEMIPLLPAPCLVVGGFFTLFTGCCTEITGILTIPAFFQASTQRPRVPAAVYIFSVYMAVMGAAAGLSIAAAIHGFLGERPNHSDLHLGDFKTMLGVRTTVAVLQTVLVVAVIPFALHCLYTDHGHLLRELNEVADDGWSRLYGNGIGDHGAGIRSVPAAGPVGQTRKLRPRQPTGRPRVPLPEVPEDEALLEETIVPVPRPPPPAYQLRVSSREGSPPPAFSGSSTRRNSVQSIWSLPPAYTAVACENLDAAALV